MNYRITIGILAHNEEKVIQNMLKSLTKQTIFLIPEFYTSIYVIANGCSDKTASISKKYLKMWHQKTPNINLLKYKIIELMIGDKANAWNLIVHNCSESLDNYIILIDSDIIIREITNLESLIIYLINNPNIDIATSQPIKYLPPTTPYWLSKISMAGSIDKEATKNRLAGSLYAAKASVLKNIWVPKGLPVEDGFIRAMVVTRSFSMSENIKYVQRCNSASHYFEGETTLVGLFKHQARIVSGSTINYIIFGYLNSIKTLHGNRNLILKNIIDKDPYFIDGLIKKYIKSKIFIIPSHFLLWRIKDIKSIRDPIKIKRVPIIILSLLFDFAAGYLAHRLIKQGKGMGHW